MIRRLIVLISHRNWAVNVFHFLKVILSFLPLKKSQTPGWMKHKLESRLLGEISITSYIQISEEGLTSLLVKVKEESEKVDLKLNTQKP